MLDLKKEIFSLKESGLYRSLRLVNSPQGAEIEIEGKRVLNFCSNNYLGLANDPRLIASGIEALEKYGAGSGAARLISGNFSLCNDLERCLSLWKGTEAALLFNSGYHANIGVIPALAGEGDLLFSDELNHASLIDGCRLSKAETIIYRHNDLNHLEDLLRRRGLARQAPTKFLIVTEAVFSMEGDVCPLKELTGLAEKQDAQIYLDEAHAVGVFGEGGGGLAPKGAGHLLVSMGTLGKAFGSYGAFIACSQNLRDYLINKARSFIFTTALPPPVIGASMAALKIVQEEPERRARLWENIKYVGANLCIRPKEGRHPGLPLQSPIASIRIGPADKTMQISQKLLDEGIYLQGIRPPTVSEGTSRLRLTVMATHTAEQIKKLTEALCVIRR